MIRTSGVSRNELLLSLTVGCAAAVLAKTGVLADLFDGSDAAPLRTQYTGVSVPLAGGTRELSLDQFGAHISRVAQYSSRIEGQASLENNAIGFTFTSTQAVESPTQMQYVVTPLEETDPTFTGPRCSDQLLGFAAVRFDYKDHSVTIPNVSTELPCDAASSHSVKIAGNSYPVAAN